MVNGLKLMAWGYGMAGRGHKRQSVGIQILWMLAVYIASVLVMAVISYGGRWLIKRLLLLL